MTHQYGLGFIEMGRCDCGRYAHLFVHSFLHNADESEPICRSCIERKISRKASWLSQYASNDDEREIVVNLEYESTNIQPRFQVELDSPLCQCCLRFISPSDTLVEASLYDGTKILNIHNHCSFSCNRCDTRYVDGSPRYQDEYTNGLQIIPRDSFTIRNEVQNESYCNTCRDEIYDEHGGSQNFFECPSCQTHELYDDGSTFGSQRYCNSCYSDNVYDCSDCGVERWSDDDHYCEQYDNSVIHDFNYRPYPQFFGSGKYYLGFELEVESRDSRYNDAEWTQDKLGAHAYMKSDGSLNDGFEIVTHPHTLEEYQKNFDWQTIKKLSQRGCRSWQTSTCGIHVHVSRTAFGDAEEPKYSTKEWNDWVLKRQAHELRFMKLIYDNQRQVERIAGRSSGFARFDDKGNLVNKVKHGHQRNDRYSAVNTENENTLEVRVFKGSLRPERVLSALEFVHASVEYTRQLRVDVKSKPFSWIRFTSYVSTNLDKYANLALIMEETFQRDSSPSDENESGDND